MCDLHECVENIMRDEALRSLATPDVRKAEDEIPELATAKLPVAPMPLSPNTTTPPVRQRNP